MSLSGLVTRCITFVKRSHVDNTTTTDKLSAEESYFDKAPTEPFLLIMKLALLHHDFSS